MKLKIATSSLLLFIIGICIGLQLKYLNTLAGGEPVTYPLTYPLSYPITYYVIDIPSLFNDNVLTVPPDHTISETHTVKVESELILNIATPGGINTVWIPAETTISREDFEHFSFSDLGASYLPTGTLTGIDSDILVRGALQWGIPNYSLVFDKPITISIDVGSYYNGHTMQIYRSNDTSSGWTGTGIIEPKTCVVADGLCTFQTTKASYFAATERLAASSVLTVGDRPCNASSPNGNTNLFQIDAKSTKATLYFVPSAETVTGYDIVYGHKPKEEVYGVSLNQGYTPGVLNYTINYLKPGTTYYFRIRPANGCTSGPWGNEMKIVTARGNSTIKYYKNFASRITSILPKNTSTIKQNQVVSQVSPTTQPYVQPAQPQTAQTSVPVATLAPVKTPSKPKTCFLFWCW